MPTITRPYYLQRTLGVLELLLAAESVTGVLVADELGIDERTARRLLRALNHAGYATPVGGWPRRYQAGPRALDLVRRAGVGELAERPGE